MTTALFSSEGAQALAGKNVPKKSGTMIGACGVPALTMHTSNEYQPSILYILDTKLPLRVPFALASVLACKLFFWRSRDLTSYQSQPEVARKRNAGFCRAEQTQSSVKR